MSRTASVYSVETLDKFRSAISRFLKETKHVLEAVNHDIQRTRRWLEQDQRFYWQGEVRRLREEVTQARHEIDRRKLSKMLGHEVYISEQIERLDQAKNRLDQAEGRLRQTLEGVVILRQAEFDYRGMIHPLAELAETGLPRSIARLDRLTAALEAYFQLEVPSPLEAERLESAITSIRRPINDVDPVDEPRPVPKHDATTNDAP